MWRAIRRARAGRLRVQVGDLELWRRSLGFAALGFLTLVPLLVVVSAADPASGRGFAQWLGDGLGVSETAREDIERLFALPGQTLRTTTAFGLAVLAVFDVSFGAVVQSGYEKVWDLSPARWWARWRHVVWLAGSAGAALLPGAVTTMAGLLGRRVLSRLVFSPLIASSAVTCGPIGTVVAGGAETSGSFRENQPPEAVPGRFQSDRSSHIRISP